MKIKKSNTINNSSTINFSLGMIMGILAAYIYNFSKLYYFIIFCPICITLFISINYNLKNERQHYAKITRKNNGTNNIK